MVKRYNIRDKHIILEFVMAETGKSKVKFDVHVYAGLGKNNFKKFQEKNQHCSLSNNLSHMRRGLGILSEIKIWCSTNCLSVAREKIVSIYLRNQTLDQVMNINRNHVLPSERYTYVV